MKRFATMELEELLKPGGHACACGRTHTTSLRGFYLGSGMLDALPEALTMAGCSLPFVVCDEHTERAAGARVKALLEKKGIPFVSYVFAPSPGHLEPDEHTMGALCMAYDPKCDGILAVGSGVINDCCKTLAHTAKVPCLVVATAPSMDGYASDNVSMLINRMKISLYNASPVAVIADTDILAAAPEIMLKAGLGDMLAKYVSICEWRIAHLVTDEYYCENIAGLMRASLAKIREHAEGLLRREPAAVERVMEGLTLSGVAMSFARLSRPASGLEHNFSHLWDMKALREGYTPELHGIQVGVGTCLTLRLYERFRALTPNREKALAWARSRTQEQWEKEMIALFGEEMAGEMIQLERAVRKNDPEKHAARLERMILHWDEILRIIGEELPPAEEIIRLMKGLGMATTPGDMGLSLADTKSAFLASREIRDKYLITSMLWDLGEQTAFTEYLDIG